MPKVRPLTENERRDQHFKEQLVGKMKCAGLTYSEVAAVLGVSLHTLYRRRDHPGELTLNERRGLLKIFPDMVIE